MGEVYVGRLVPFRHGDVTHAYDPTQYAQSGRRRGVAPVAGTFVTCPARAWCYFAYSIARDSRMTVTLI